MFDISKTGSQSDISKLLEQLGAKASYFSLSSRYKDVPMATIKGSSDEPIIYLRRRFLPGPERFFLLQEHRVQEGDRIDNITSQYLGDPERFWQVCDANNAMVPGELTEEPGDTIKITLPEGIPGSRNA